MDASALGSQDVGETILAKRAEERRHLRFILSLDALDQVEDIVLELYQAVHGLEAPDLFVIGDGNTKALSAGGACPNQAIAQTPHLANRLPQEDGDPAKILDVIAGEADLRNSELAGHVHVKAGIVKPFGLCDDLRSKPNVSRVNHHIHRYDPLNKLANEHVYG